MFHILVVGDSNLIGQISPFIHIDQFGYHSNSSKVAVLSDPQVGFNASDYYNPGSSLEVRDFQSDVVVFSASPQIWDNGNTHAQSGDQGWWFDFSSVTSDGTYYILDPSNGEKSAPFNINTNPYQDMVKAVFKTFYYNRCNATKESPYALPGWQDGMNFTNAGQDANCRFAYNQGNASLEKDLTGGWFDAGDYNKYVTFAHSAVHQLMYAYEDNPSLFDDDWNIPESGNGMSDLLDEVKWELDWLLKMVNSDGSVINKMGSVNFNENAEAPPSINTDSRFYGYTCTSSSIAASSMLAHASQVFSAQSGMASFASTLENKAIDCWNYFIPFYNANNLEIDCDDNLINAGDADWNAMHQLEAALIAATYLFTITGDMGYSNFVRDNYHLTEPITTGYWSPYKIELCEALLIYANLPGADGNTASDIKSKAAIPVIQNVVNEYTFTNLDLYRAFANDPTYHWGSNLIKASHGTMALIMNKYNIAPSQQVGLSIRAEEMLHYFHGVNPLGLVYLSNMYAYGGDRCVNEIYHTWFADGSDWDNAITSPFGPAPGFLTGGANKDFSLPTISPPAGQPEQKSFLDFNDDWPNNSWEITEPSISYQAGYLRLLAHYTNTDVVSSVVNIMGLNQCVEAFPCPVNDIFTVRGVLSNYNIGIYDVNGNLYQTVSNTGAEINIDVSSLPAGMFLLKVENSNNNVLCIQQILKFN